MILLLVASGTGSAIVATTYGLGTWGFIMQAGYSWGYMSGDGFANTTGNATAWTVLPRATQNC